jgi:hypothetical protein
METDKIIVAIDEAILEANNYANEYCKGDKSSVIDTQKVLQLLLTEIESQPENIDEEILSAMHDVGMSSYKEFENTPLEEAINKVTELLYLCIPDYKKLNPLGAGFENWISSMYY